MKEQSRQPPLPSLRPEGPFSPFFLLTADLIIVPTPIAICIPAYRALYASVHANPTFCKMGFGHHFPARTWSDDETRDVIQTRDVELCWKERSIGDFAVGLRMGEDKERPLTNDIGRILVGEGQEIQIVDGDHYSTIVEAEDRFLKGVEWVGYAGVRDATTTSMPERVHGDPELPPWQEMVELRYGVAPEYWGKGIARSAAEAVVQWAVSERGVKRFIAETEKENVRSGRVLEKVGFKLSGTDYWKELSEVEWERIVS